MKVIVLGLVSAAFAVSAAAAAPPSPPPIVSGTKPPPAAWIETTQGSLWLGYSSFCWRASCADFILPSCVDRSHTPTILVRRGERVRFHLGLAPRKVEVMYVGKSSTRLATSRLPSRRVTGSGVFRLSVRGRYGDASYVGCLRFVT